MKKGDFIFYYADPEIPEEELTETDIFVGIVEKQYWNGDIGILDPYALDNGEIEFHIISKDQMLGYYQTGIWYKLSQKMAKLMPLEMYPLIPIGISVLIYLVQLIGGKI